MSDVNLFIFLAVVTLLAFAVYAYIARQSRLPEQRKEALPVDPGNPPSWKVYQPRTGAPARSCACHPDRPLNPGQKVLWWPVPNSGGGVNVYCEEGIEV